MRAIDCRGRDSLRSGEEALVRAVAAAGGVIVFPTDTLYGLGADPFSAAGVGKVFRLKGRHPGKPLLVLLEEPALVGRFADSEPEPVRELARRFWPGPLTLLYPARRGLLPGVRSAEGTVALRVPGSPLCRAVLRAAGGCLTGTSANPSGGGGGREPAPAAAALAGEPELLVDAGPLPPSRVSTIAGVDPRGRVAILREGAIAAAEILAAAGTGTPGSGGVSQGQGGED